MCFPNKSYVRLAAIVGALVMFGRFFNHWLDQRLVDSLWVLAVALWASEVRSYARGPVSHVRVRCADVLPIAVILAVFVVAWLPFYDNWRWAYTGDSLGTLDASYILGTKGLQQNILSVHGLEDSFTYLWVLAYNIPTLLFGPSFFWHRCGLLMMSCLSLAAIYTYFTLVLGRSWSAAIVVGTASNYVWLWFSYVSYYKIDSFIFYYLMLALATLTWRKPDQVGLWMWCGFIAGLSLFFTPTAWSGVAFVGLLLGVFAVATRRFRALLVAAVSFLIIATPILLEIPWLLSMTARQTQPVLEWDYISRIFRTLLLLPYDSGIYNLGVQGAFLRWPLGSLYVVGFVLSALAVAPPIRRWLRVPAVAPVLLALLLWDITLLSLTNRGYAGPSTKRAYNLIPLQIFFALVPAYVLYAWVAPRVLLRRLTVTLVGVALVIYACTNVRLMMFPPRWVYGFNLLDGLVELRQRFPERRVVLFLSHPQQVPELTPNCAFQLAYKINDQTTVQTAFVGVTMDRACEQRAIVCYLPNPDEANMSPLLDEYRTRLTPFSLLNSNQLLCFECAAARSASGSSAPNSPAAR